MCFVTPRWLLYLKQKELFQRRKRTGQFARKLPHVVYRVIAWMDDMKGGRSKRYAPFMNMFIINAGMNVQNVHSAVRLTCETCAQRNSSPAENAAAARQPALCLHGALFRRAFFFLVVDGCVDGCVVLFCYPTF